MYEFGKNPTAIQNQYELPDKLATFVPKFTVEQIHQDFFSAFKKYEVVPELNSNDEFKRKIIERGIQMEKFGFVGQQEVGLSKQYIREDEDKIYFNHIVTKYAKKYPFNKVIFHDDVISLCEKYDLFFTTVGRYKGVLPTKNLNEISNFKFNQDDFMYSGIMEGNPMPVLHIVAPLNDLELNESEIKGRTIENKQPVKDPIVLVPIKETFNHPNRYNINGVWYPINVKQKQAYIIVTAWGDEASDELVVHESRN